MEKLADLPPLALVIFGATLAVIFAVRYLGLWSGRNAAPEKSSTAAQVAAVIVDPSALNHATAALNKHTEVLEEMIEVERGMARSVDHVAIELDRIREELRIQREISRRN